MIQELSTRILREGLDDWVPMLAIEGMARKLKIPAGSPTHDAIDRSLRELLDLQLISIGTVGRQGFAQWNCSTDEALKPDT